MGLFGGDSTSVQQQITRVVDNKTTGAEDAITAGQGATLTVTDGGIVADALKTVDLATGRGIDAAQRSLETIERANVRNNDLVSRIIDTEARLKSGELQNVADTFLSKTAPLAIMAGLGFMLIKGAKR